MVTKSKMNLDDLNRQVKRQAQTMTGGNSQQETRTAWDDIVSAGDGRPRVSNSETSRLTNKTEDALGLARNEYSPLSIGSSVRPEPRRGHSKSSEHRPKRCGISRGCGTGRNRSPQRCDYRERHGGDPSRRRCRGRTRHRQPPGSSRRTPRYRSEVKDLQIRLRRIRDAVNAI